MMEDKEKIKRWATDRLAEVEADIAKRFGVSERFYQDLIAKRVVLSDLLSLIRSMQEGPKTIQGTGSITKQRMIMEKKPIMIPFSMEYREKIESGEYKVVTRDGRPVRIGMWDVKAPTCVVGTYKYDKDDPDDQGEIFAGWTREGKCGGQGREHLDLFIVAPELQLSVFEEACLREFFLLSPQDILPEFLTKNRLKEKCAAMLDAARKEIQGELPVWKQIEPGREYPLCLTREIGDNRGWRYCISSGKIDDGCQYILLAELEQKLKSERAETARTSASAAAVKQGYVD